MTVRRIAAVLLFLTAGAMVWVAILTPLRSAEIAELDAEAERLGIEWAEEQDDALAAQSNEAYAAARDLEPPLAPLTAIGAGLLLTAAGIALWPPSPER